MDSTASSSSSTTGTSSYHPVANHFFFALNNQSYYPGKIVDGVIVAIVQSPIKVHKIGIHWKGHEYVSWFQGVSQTDHRHAQNTLFDNHHVIWPKPEDKEVPKIFEPGTYRFDVSWDGLPDKLPANFEERNHGANKSGPTAAGSGTSVDTGSVLPFVFSTGMLPRSFGDIPSYIRYGATAFMDFEIPTPPESSQSSDPQATATTTKPKLLRLQRQNPFKVCENFDKSIIIQPSIVKPLSHSFMMGGQLTGQVSVANGGVLFVGQNVFLNLKVVNNSSWSVESVTLALNELIKFSAPHPQQERLSVFERSVEVLSAPITNLSVKPKGSFQQDFTFNVPANTQGSIGKAKYIQRDYQLDVKLNVAYSAQPIIVSAPIVLLEWSPLLKDELPKQVPITIAPTNTALTTSTVTSTTASTTTTATTTTTAATTSASTAASASTTTPSTTGDGDAPAENYEEDSSEDV